MHDGPELAMAAVGVGARACLLKSNLDSLVDTVRVFAGEIKPVLS